MDHFPIFVALAGRRVVLSGGGEAALAEPVRAFRFRRSAEQLLENARAANVFVDRTTSPTWATMPCSAGSTSPRS